MKYSKKEKTRRVRQSLSEILSRYCDIPADLIGGMMLEMRGRNELLICGCRRLIEYSGSRIVVAAACRIEIRGRRLGMSSFGEGRILICGEIDTINLGEERTE